MVANAATESKVRELFTSVMADVKSSLAGESFARLILEAVGGKYAWSQASLVHFLAHSFLAVHAAQNEIERQVAVALEYLATHAFIVLKPNESDAQQPNSAVTGERFECVPCRAAVAAT